MHANSYGLMRSALEDLRLTDSLVAFTALDVGARVVDGQRLSYSSLFSGMKCSYLGMDIEPGENVDIVVGNPYDWKELKSDSFDLVICGQALEHIPYFWDVFQEMARVLKPEGSLIVIVPSKGAVHRYPVDCFRFQPDGLILLASRYGLRVVSVTVDEGSYWGDLMLIAKKESASSQASVLESHVSTTDLTLISRVARRRRVLDIALSIVAILIGEQAFMTVVDFRNRVRKLFAD